MPNRQIQVNRKFAYLALAAFCQSGKLNDMEDRAPENRIREIREGLDMTIEQLAEASGLSVSYLSRLESGARNLSHKNMNLISAQLGVSAADLVRAEVPMPNVVRVMGRIGAGAEISPDDEQVPPEGLYEIETAYPLPPDAIAFEVTGDSQWPRYDDGDVIICWRQGIVAEEILGWEAAVKTTDGHRYLKRVLRGSQAGTYDLESHNAPPIRGVRLEWVASIQSVVRSGQWKKLTEAGRSRLVKRMMGAN